MEQLLVKKLSEHASLPTKGSKLAAGFDLHSAYDYVIKPQGKELVKTDLSVRVPEGTYGRVAPRSGLAVKHFIDVGAGVIDRDYRGNVGIVLFNFGTEEFVVKKGDKVAQLVLEKIYETEVKEVEDLDQTERGQDGFGSTGVSTEGKMESDAKRMKTDSEEVNPASIEVES